MSTARRNGMDILLYANTGTSDTPVWTVVAGQRSVDLDEALGTIDQTGKDSSGNQEFGVGLYSAKLSLDGAYCPTDTAYQALRTAIRGREKIKIRAKESSTYTLEGTGIVTSCKLSAPLEEVATYSIEVQVDGGLTESPT